MAARRWQRHLLHEVLQSTRAEAALERQGPQGGEGEREGQAPAQLGAASAPASVRCRGSQCQGRGKGVA
eukprot:7895378-Alexandrium_andersonii.AAC.1